MKAWLRKLLSPTDLIATLLAFCIVGIFWLLAFNISFLNPISRALSGFTTTDVYYSIMSEMEPEESPLITLVDVTNLYSRDSIATLLEEITDLEPAVVDVDIMFERPHYDEHDTHLALAASDMENAVFSYKLLNYNANKQEYTRIVHSFFAKEMELQEGFVNISRNTIRDIPLWQYVNGKKCPSVVAQVASKWNGNPVNFDGPQSHPISYTPTSFPVVTWDSIHYYKDLIRSHIVMVGGVKEAVDICYTPVGPKYGIEVLAYGVQTLLDHNDNVQIEGFWFIVISVALVILSCRLRRGYYTLVSFIPYKRLRAVLSTSFIGAIRTFVWMVILVFCGFYLFYHYQINMDLTLVLSCLAVLSTASEFQAIFFRRKDKKEPSTRPKK